PEEGDVLHRPAGRDGRRRSSLPRPVFRHDDRPALARPRRRGGLVLRVRFPAADSLRESRGGVTRRTGLLRHRLTATAGLLLSGAWAAGAARPAAIPAAPDSAPRAAAASPAAPPGTAATSPAAATA